jgi:hypothetical protein
MYSILEQLGSNFQTQLTKKTFEWCDKYKYDFYFETNNEKYIIETHGLQHYEENNNFEMSLSEQIENDRLKKELAIKNGIKEENYIVIDCRRSELDWIKSDIIKSNLFKLYDFKNVNWTKVVEFTSANLSKVACNYKKENIKLSCIDISKIMGFHANTIRQWIEKGIESDFFKNDSENSNIDINLIKFKLRHLKPIICIENKNVYKSVVDISADSENIFGEYFYKNSISRVARGQRKQYKNFTFKYVEDLTQDEFIKYNIKNKLQKLIELEQS